MNAEHPTLERRAESQKHISQLVAERTEMLTLYSNLAASRPLKSNSNVPDLMEQFCEALVDYTADTHFRLYKYIDAKMERRRAILQIAETIYPRILETTDAILDFNDKYDALENTSYNALEEDLSMLGVVLADRIEAEDKLINVLLRKRD